jgi:hypothetical protein
MASETGGTLYLFSSCLRRIYKEQNFECLAYPPGFVLRFRYEATWVHETVPGPDSLDGMEGVVVVTVGEPGEFSFRPIRAVTVQSAEYRGSTLVLDLQLEARLADYTEGTDPAAAVGALPAAPATLDRDDDTDALVVADADAEIEFVGGGGDADAVEWRNAEGAWDAIVDELGAHEEFGSHLFYRVVSLEASTEEEIVEPVPVYGARRGYSISPDTNYRLEFSLRFGDEPHENADEMAFEVRAGDPIQVLPDGFTLGFRSDDRSVHLSPSRPVRAVTTVPLVTGVADDHDVEAATLELPLRLEPNTRRRTVAVGLIFVGIGLASGLPDPFLPAVAAELPVGVGRLRTFVTLLGVAVTAFAFDVYRTAA